jgi:glycosyltransferase involved in cell wall biosynthesis
MTTAHARDEVRIFLKECLSLKSAGYEVNLIVADGRGFSTTLGVYIHDAGVVKSRFRRMLLLPIKMLKRAIDIDADVYHLHEPELLLIALPMIFRGKKVIYDSHEDVPRAVLSRDWIPVLFRNGVSGAVDLFENLVVAKISAVVGATPYIAARFSKKNRKTIAVNNYPLMTEIVNSKRQFSKSNKICYQGFISKHRGIFEILCALKHSEAKLVLAGPIEDPDAKAKIEILVKSERVEYRGVVSRFEVKEIMQRSCAGLLLFHPEPNHINAQPNKLFEYMSAGLPVIASNFLHWRKIIEDSECGICVDPLDVKAIANAISYLLENPKIAQKLGENGKRAVLNKYNWSFEEKKLLALYENIFGEIKN